LNAHHRRIPRQITRSSESWRRSSINQPGDFFNGIRASLTIRSTSLIPESVQKLPVDRYALLGFDPSSTRGLEYHHSEGCEDKVPRSGGKIPHLRRILSALESAVNGAKRMAGRMAYKGCDANSLAINALVRF
jgi:hypothetical protein